VIVFTENNQQYKVMRDDYLELFNARGNEPSIKFRYLQVRMNRRQREMLYYLYPNMINDMEEYENIIYEIAKSIYQAYVNRFIKKEHVTVSREKFSVVRECHEWHQFDRSTNRVTLNKVIDILNNQCPTNINKMIRQFRTESEETPNQTNVAVSETVTHHKRVLPTNHLQQRTQHDPNRDNTTRDTTTRDTTTRDNTHHRPNTRNVRFHTQTPGSSADFNISEANANPNPHPVVGPNFRPGSTLRLRQPRVAQNIGGNPTPGGRRTYDHTRG
jgi:hypothetical protein